MRCVDKGAAPKGYAHYRDARNDLAGRIGWFCSYCEMPVKNMLEIEHAHPVKNGGNELAWENFLLSCRYCNGVKNNRNSDRAGFLWPDIDNTFNAFEYSERDIVGPRQGLPAGIKEMASRTIELMGLDRRPGAADEPTKSDARWVHRIMAWGIIEDSYKDWQTNKTEAFARQIARTAHGHGFYSFWIKKFEREPLVINEINQVFENTYSPRYSAQGALIVRTGGSY